MRRSSEKFGRNGLKLTLNSLITQLSSNNTRTSTSTLSRNTAVKFGPPLKIGFVLDGGIEKPDGVQQYIINLGKYFISQGHSVRYIVAGNVPDNISGTVSLARSIRVKSNGNILSIPLPA